MITYSSIQSVPWIWEGDSALDKQHPDYNREAYERTGDLKHLPIVAGSTPRVFHVRRLSRKQFFRVMGLSVSDQVQESVAYGLASMEPADTELARKKTDAGDRLTEQALDRLFDLGAPVMISLGTFIITLGKTDPT